MLGTLQIDSPQHAGKFFHALRFTKFRQHLTVEARAIPSLIIETWGAPADWRYSEESSGDLAEGKDNPNVFQSGTCESARQTL